MLRATISRCAMPPDRVFTSAEARSARRNRSRSSSARWRASRVDIPKYFPWWNRFSHAVRLRSRVFVWDTTPITRLVAVGCATTSIPAIHAEPPEGITRVVSMPTVVVLPAPLGPRSPKISPA